MSILSRIRDAFTTPDLNSLDEAVIWSQRAVEPFYPVYADPMVIGSKLLGITDMDAPTTDEQRTHYHGLVSTLTTMRAYAIADALSKAEVKRKLRPGELEDVEDDHPWSRLLAMPSPNYSPFEFWEDASRLQDMGAGAFMLVGFGSFRVPEGLFTIFPEFGEVKPQGSEDGGIGGYVHYAHDGVREIDRRLMIWLHHRHPVSPYEGASLLEQAAYQSDKGLYMDIYGRDLVKDGNVPPIYLKTDQMITTDQAKSYGQQVTRNYRAAGQKMMTPVLGQGIEFKTMAINPNDLQYVEAAELNDRQIMRIFGFPPAMFEQSGVVANSKEVRRQWLQNSIQPEVNRICASLTHQFKVIFRAEGSDLCIVPPNVVPVDRMEQARIDEMEIRNMVLKPNEVRLREGREEDPDLDQFFASGSYRPLRELVMQEDESNEPENDDAPEEQDNDQ